MLKVIAIQSIGIGLDEIYNRQHNIWIGISFSNKIFTLDNIKALIDFALLHTKEKILILIPGRLQSANYYYFDKLSRAKALRKAFEEEDNLKSEINKLITELPDSQRKIISIASYDDVLTPLAIKRRELLYREFAKPGKFYDQVLQIVADILASRGREFEKRKAESLALYVLQELCLFLGIQKNNDPTVYTAIAYPGLGKFDAFIEGIVTGKEYPKLTKNLAISYKTGIIDIKFE